MTQTVIGFFNNSSEAEQAIQQLQSKNIARQDIDISYGDTNTSTSNTTMGTDGTEEESGISKFFKNLFGDNKEDVEKYSNAAAKSSCIVTVHAKSEKEAEMAADILDDYGATNVDENADEDSTFSTAPAMSSTTGTTMQAATSNTPESIKIIEEKLEVGKRDVQTGGMRLRSRIVERPVEEQLRLRQEKVSVARNTVDRPATEADFTAFKEGAVEMIETAEVPVVSKQARVVEEISLGKEVTEKEETVRDTVRKTEVDIENIKGSDDSFINKTKTS